MPIPCTPLVGDSFFGDSNKIFLRSLSFSNTHSCARYGRCYYCCCCCQRCFFYSTLVTESFVIQLLCNYMTTITVASPIRRCRRGRGCDRFCYSSGALLKLHFVQRHKHTLFCQHFWQLHLYVEQRKYKMKWINQLWSILLTRCSCWCFSFC